MSCCGRGLNYGSLMLSCTVLSTNQQGKGKAKPRMLVLAPTRSVLLLLITPSSPALLLPYADPACVGGVGI